MVLPKISFFNVLKHTCLIIFSIDFLIQPPDLNEVFQLVYNILIPYCFCQKVSWRTMLEHYNTKSLFEGLRGKLCCGFALLWLRFQNSPSSDFICAGYTLKGMLFSGYCMILFKFCLETNSLFCLFAFLGFILTAQPKLESEI